MRLPLPLFVKKYKDYFVDGFFLLGLMILFFSRWIFKESYTLFTSDVIQDFSMHHFASFSFSHFEIPLWDPYFTGALIGYLNSGIFYPFNLIMDIIASFRANNLNIGYLLMEGNAFFHYFLASFFMYIMCRYFSLSRLPSLVAGITFGYGGYLVKEYVHLAYLQGGVWLPLVFLFFYKGIFEKARFTVLSGFFFGISLLAGQTQPAIYYIFILLVFSLYKIFSLYQEENKISLRPLVLFFLFSLISFGVFAVQFFPTNEYAQYSSRQQLGESDVVAYSAKPLYLLVHPFIPTFWGSMSSKTWDGVEVNGLPKTGKTIWVDTMYDGLMNEMNFYIGLLPFFLLPFSFFAKNSHLRNFFLLLLFFSVILMLSESLAFVGQIYYYLLKATARVPVRASFIWTFSLAFLAALGLQVIVEAKDRFLDIFKKISLAYFLVFAFLLFFVLPILVFLMLLGAGSYKMPFYYFPMVNAFALFIIYFLIYSTLVFFLLRSRQKVLPLFLIVLFFVIELFSFHAKNSYIIPSRGAPEFALGRRGELEIDLLKRDSGYFRVYGLGLAAYANHFFTLGYGTTGSSGFAYRPALEFHSIIKDEASPLYDLLNVKYFYVEGGKLKDLKSSVTASSFLPDHSPDFAFDNDPETEWVINPASNDQEDGWILAPFRSRQDVARFEFLGRDNNRDKEIRTLEFLFSDGSKQEVSLQPGKGWKTVSIKPTTTDWIRFSVKSFDLERGRNAYYGLREIIVTDVSGTKVAVGSPKFKQLSNNLFENKNVFPRAFIVHSYSVYNDREAMFSALLEDGNGEKMRRSAFLYKKPPSFDSADFPVEGSQATILSYKNKSVVVKTEAKEAGLLILSDVWFPGWKAQVDGREVEILSAYHFLRAVEIPSGQHLVRLYYDPSSFKVGLTITLLTLALLIFYFWKYSPLKVRD